MRTQLCLYPRRSQRRPQITNHLLSPLIRESRKIPVAPFKKGGRGDHPGQVLVIFGISVLVLIFFIGLAIDAGSVYVTYGQLKRAVDGAAVAAANTFKRGETLQSMTASAEEVLHLQNIDLDTVTLNVFICDENGDGVRDASLQTEAPQFYARCPSGTEAPRKLVWVQATQKAPFYFLSLLGFQSIDLSTNAIAEAAPVDLIIVLDVSESMTDQTPNKLGQEGIYNPNDPVNGCNVQTEVSSYTSSGDATSHGACQPLWDAKNAASRLIDTLYQGYDRVGIITFDSQSRVISNLTDDLTDAKARLWSQVGAHDDPPGVRIWSNWQTAWANGPYHGVNRAVNMVNPDDLDGDGRDYDSPARLGYTCPDFNDPANATILADRWWTVDEGAPDVYGWGGVPCDDPSVEDAYDWNNSGVYDQADIDATQAYNSLYQSAYAPNRVSFSPIDTCTGCGLREASNQFKADGRPGSVWVMVFLSDGAANLSDTAGAPVFTSLGDTPNTGGDIPSTIPDGFCGGAFEYLLGYTFCMDRQFSPRYCLYDNNPSHDYRRSDECPTDSIKIYVGGAPSDVREYTPVDYAMDMTDEAALTKSDNPNEPLGNDVAIYSIGLNVPLTGSAAEPLLRYMAAVGDDGDRTTDPCRTVAAGDNCGQYYFTANSGDLAKIFDDIASRIYTRITE
jgi:hypothetical protein